MLAIGSVALVGLIVSAAAINQILPGYFAEQTRERLASAVTFDAGADRMFTETVGPSPPPRRCAMNSCFRGPTVRVPRVLIPARVDISDAEGRSSRSSPPDVGA